MHIYSFDETPNRIAIINGKEYLFFSGYNYLGMNSVPEFAALVKEGTGKYGWLFPSSRISNTRLKIFEEAEELLFGYEAGSRPDQARRSAARRGPRR